MRIELSTRDAKGLTAKDFQLALQIDALIDKDFSGLVLNLHS
jgi:pterin-4a-carbinolamine dehydratase